MRDDCRLALRFPRGAWRYSTVSGARFSSLLRLLARPRRRRRYYGCIPRSTPSFSLEATPVSFRSLAGVTCSQERTIGRRERERAPQGLEVRKLSRPQRFSKDRRAHRLVLVAHSIRDDEGGPPGTRVFGRAAASRSEAGQGRLCPTDGDLFVERDPEFKILGVLWVRKVELQARDLNLRPQTLGDLDERNHPARIALPMALGQPAPSATD